MWIRKEAAFDPVIPLGQFLRAQQIIQARSKHFVQQKSAICVYRTCSLRSRSNISSSVVLVLTGCRTPSETHSYSSSTNLSYRVDFYGGTGAESPSSTAIFAVRQVKAAQRSWFFPELI